MEKSLEQLENERRNEIRINIGGIYYAPSEIEYMIEKYKEYKEELEKLRCGN